MIAQVNLYHARFRKKHLLLSFSRMVIITLVAALSIPAMTSLNTMQLNKLNAQSASLKADYNRLEDEWKRVSNLLSQKSLNSGLAAESVKLETILAHRIELLKFISDNSFEDNSGYSDYLIALARQHSSNIWLTSINIIKNGTTMSIEGKVNHSGILPKYLQRLSKETILTGTQFDTLAITRDADESTKSFPLSFVITSAAGARQ